MESRICVFSKDKKQNTLTTLTNGNGKINIVKKSHSGGGLLDSVYYYIINNSSCSIRVLPYVEIVMKASLGTGRDSGLSATDNNIFKIYCNCIETTSHHEGAV